MRAQFSAALRERGSLRDVPTVEMIFETLRGSSWDETLRFRIRNSCRIGVRCGMMDGGIIRDQFRERRAMAVQAAVASLKFLEDKWDDAAASKLDAPELLRYRSNLLGSDLRITNFAGGNTSSKVEQVDPVAGLKKQALWVK